MSIRTKALLAAIIWVTVGYLAWNSIFRVLPQYGFFQPKPVRMTPDDWRKLYQEEEARAKKFLDSGAKPTRVTASPAAPGQQLNYEGRRSDDTREVVYAKNMPLRRIISRLSGVPARRVVEPGNGSSNWDVEAVLPAGREESVAALLQAIKWKGDAYQLPERVYILGSGSPPAAAAPAPRGGRSMDLGKLSLGDAVRAFRNFGQVNVRVDRAVRNNKPLDPANANLQFGGSPERMLGQLAAIYGVGLSKDTEDTTHILLYTSGSKTGGDMDDWIKTLREKALAE